MGEAAGSAVGGPGGAAVAVAVAGRGRLTRPLILAAAVRLADREGLPALSMRRLGQELGVEGMALYKHFPSKDALLDGVVGTLLAAMTIPAVDPAPGGWQAGARAIAHAYRRLAHDHPHLFPLVVARPLAAPEVLRPLEATLAILRAGGFDPETALRAFRTIASFVAGFALDEIAGPATPPSVGGGRPSPLAAFADLPPAAFPRVTEAAPHAAHADADADFAFGLDVILVGLEARRPGRPTR